MLEVCDLPSFSGSPQSEAESRLYHHLFDIYNPLIRPVQNTTETITIEFNLALSQIINVVSISVMPCTDSFSGAADQLPLSIGKNDTCTSPSCE